MKHSILSLGPVYVYQGQNLIVKVYPDGVTKMELIRLSGGIKSTISLSSDEVGRFYNALKRAKDFISQAETEQSMLKNTPIPTNPDINLLVDDIYRSNKEAGWWDDVNSKEKLDEITPTKLCLIHSEISEAMEGHRKGLRDDKLPHRTMFEVELADAVIRIFDLAGAYNISLGTIIDEKRAYNAERSDHKRENRAKKGGKRY